MAGTTNHWKLGLFITVSILTFLGLLFWLGASRLHRDSIQAYCYFDEVVSGLETGAPVKFRGVTIGRVARIRAASDRRHVEVLSDIYLDAIDSLGLTLEAAPQGPDGSPFVPDNLRVQLTTPVFGEAVIESDFFDLETHPVPEYPFTTPWNTVHSEPSTYKSIAAAAVVLAEKIPKLLDRVEEELDGLRLTERLDQADATMKSVQSRIDNLDDIQAFRTATTTLEELRVLLAEVRAFVAELRDDSGPIKTLAQRYDRIGQQLEEALGEADLIATMAAIRDIGAGVDDAANDISLLSQDARAEIAALSEMLEAVQRLAELLERDPGALLHGRSIPAAGTRR